MGACQHHKAGDQADHRTGKQLEVDDELKPGHLLAGSHAVSRLAVGVGIAGGNLGVLGGLTIGRILAVGILGILAIMGLVLVVAGGLLPRWGQLPAWGILLPGRRCRQLRAAVGAEALAILAGTPAGWAHFGHNCYLLFLFEDTFSILQNGKPVNLTLPLIDKQARSLFQVDSIYSQHCGGCNQLEKISQQPAGIQHKIIV